METKQKIDKTEFVMERIDKRILYYMKKENRERAYKILKQNNIPARRTTSSNQFIHPEYVEDYSGEIETGFGNSIYSTHFKRLYNLEVLE